MTTQDPYGYVTDVPDYSHTPCLTPIPDVDALLSFWEGAGIVPIRVGTGLTLGYALAGAGLGSRAPADVDGHLLERWAPLLAARLDGGRVACAVADCQHDAAVMLVGGVAVCPGHAAAPVGTEIEQPQPAKRGSR